MSNSNKAPSSLRKPKGQVAIPEVAPESQDNLVSPPPIVGAKKNALGTPSKPGQTESKGPNSKANHTDLVPSKQTSCHKSEVDPKQKDYKIITLKQTEMTSASKNNHLKVFDYSSDHNIENPSSPTPALNTAQRPHLVSNSKLTTKHKADANNSTISRKSSIKGQLSTGGSGTKAVRLKSTTKRISATSSTLSPVKRGSDNETDHQADDDEPYENIVAKDRSNLKDYIKSLQGTTSKIKTRKSSGSFARTKTAEKDGKQEEASPQKDDQNFSLNRQVSACSKKKTRNDTMAEQNAEVDIHDLVDKEESLEKDSQMSDFQPNQTKLETEGVLQADTSGDDLDTDENNDVNDLIEVEQGSNMFDTDSSATHDDLRSVDQGEMSQDDQMSNHSSCNRSPGVFSLKRKKAAEKILPPEPKEPESREEMGGTLVYDAYSRLVGCSKIEEYFNATQPKKLNVEVLFSKAESKEVFKEIFGEKARERDFQSDQDKNYFRNLPRFTVQREFSNLQHTLHIPNQQNILIFDSRFENGNLRKAAKVSNIEYNLWLENDVNTKGHTQWYYFKVVYKNVALHADKKSHRIKFNILNLAKTSSLYQQGMKPCIWSKQRNEKEGVGWFRGGDNISYSQNHIPRYENQINPPKFVKGNYNNAFLLNNNGAGEGVDYYYTFSFIYEFAANEDDEVYFAHAIPYNFSQLQDTLLQFKQDEQYSSFLKMNILCFTLAKLPVPLLTITENVGTYLDYYEEMRLLHQIPNVVKKAYRQKYQKARKLARQGDDSKGRVKRLLEAAFEEEIKQFFEYNEDHFLTTSPSFQGFGNRLCQYLKDHSLKKALFFTCRVHPGEPQSSHMLDGLLKYLLSKEAAELRKHFVIRIVPMLNPDGVVYGNYRCSLLGCDLNRKWEKPNRLLHPSIFHSKQLIRHMHGERKVVLYLDLHGHSRKQNAFFYGCCYKNYEQEGRIKNAQLRIIPLLCCQKNTLFSLKDSRFNIEKCKESTGRVVVFKELNIMNSFTLEASFFGKEWKNPQTESMQKESGGGSFMMAQKRRLLHMSLADYQSLGETIMQVMNSYLPSEQSKLQFISGKILDVFYDEFIKFIPAYILKREEEKRRRMEGQLVIKPKPAGPTSTATAQGQSARNALTRKSKMVNATVTGGAVRETAGPSSQMPTKRVGQQQKGSQNYMSVPRKREHLASAFSGSRGGKKEKTQVQLDREADRTAAAKAKLAGNDESSDQKMVVGLSGKDETDTDHFNSIINIPNNQNEIMEFESFMNKIQAKLKEKEMRKRQKLQRLIDETLGKNSQLHNFEEDLLNGQLNLYISDSSSNDTSEEEDFKRREKIKTKAKKQKQLEKLLKKAQEKTKKKQKKKQPAPKEEPKSPKSTKSVLVKKGHSKHKQHAHHAAQDHDGQGGGDEHFIRQSSSKNQPLLHHINMELGLEGAGPPPKKGKRVSVGPYRLGNLDGTAAGSVERGEDEGLKHFQNLSIQNMIIERQNLSGFIAQFQSKQQDAPSDSRQKLAAIRTNEFRNPAQSLVGDATVKPKRTGVPDGKESPPRFKSLDIDSSVLAKEKSGGPEKGGRLGAIQAIAQDQEAGDTLKTRQDYSKLISNFEGEMLVRENLGPLQTQNTLQQEQAPLNLGGPQPAQPRTIEDTQFTNRVDPRIYQLRDRVRVVDEGDLSVLSSLTKLDGQPLDPIRIQQKDFVISGSSQSKNRKKQLRQIASNKEMSSVEKSKILHRLKSQFQGESNFSQFDIEQASEVFWTQLNDQKIPVVRAKDIGQQDLVYYEAQGEHPPIVKTKREKTSKKEKIKSKSHNLKNPVLGKKHQASKANLDGLDRPRLAHDQPQLGSAVQVLSREMVSIPATHLPPYDSRPHLDGLDPSGWGWLRGSKLKQQDPESQAWLQQQMRQELVIKGSHFEGAPSTYHLQQPAGPQKLTAKAKGVGPKQLQQIYTAAKVGQKSPLKEGRSELTGRKTEQKGALRASEMAPQPPLLINNHIPKGESKSQLAKNPGEMPSYPLAYPPQGLGQHLAIAQNHFGSNYQQDYKYENPGNGPNGITLSQSTGSFLPATQGPGIKIQSPTRLPGEGSGLDRSILDRSSIERHNPYSEQGPYPPHPGQFNSGSTKKLLKKGEQQQAQVKQLRQSVDQLTKQTSLPLPKYYSKGAVAAEQPTSVLGPTPTIAQQIKGFSKIQQKFNQGNPGRLLIKDPNGPSSVGVSQSSLANVVFMIPSSSTQSHVQQQPSLEELQHISPPGGHSGQQTNALPQPLQSRTDKKQNLKWKAVAMSSQSQLAQSGENYLTASKPQNPQLMAEYFPEINKSPRNNQTYFTGSQHHYSEKFIVSQKRLAGLGGGGGISSSLQFKHTEKMQNEAIDRLSSQQVLHNHQTKLDPIISAKTVKNNRGKLDTPEMSNSVMGIKNEKKKTKAKLERPPSV